MSVQTQVQGARRGTPVLSLPINVRTQASHNRAAPLFYVTTTEVNYLEWLRAQKKCQQYNRVPSKVNRMDRQDEWSQSPK